MFFGTAQVSHQVCQFFMFSSVCRLVRVTMVGKTMLSRAVWTLWDSLRELRSSLCERRLDRTVLRPALSPVIIAQFLRQVLRHTVKTRSL
jgi:hypothetical protein